MSEVKKLYPVSVSFEVLVAAESQDAAEAWMAKNSGEVMSDQDGSGCLDITAGDEVTALAQLGGVCNGEWTVDAQAYNAELTIGDMLDEQPAPGRCDKTIDMFSPCPNPVTAGIDRDTTGAIGQP